MHVAKRWVEFVEDALGKARKLIVVEPAAHTASQDTQIQDKLTHCEGWPSPAATRNPFKPMPIRILKWRNAAKGLSQDPELSQ